MSIRHRALRSVGLSLLVVATLATAAVRATRPERDDWFPAAATHAARPMAPPNLAAAQVPSGPQRDRVLDFLDRLRAGHT